MFTGIVQQTADITLVRRKTGSLVIAVRLGKQAEEIAVGDSVLVDGVCLTAVSISGDEVSFDVSAETVRLTTFMDVKAGQTVNIEPAMRLSDRFGGHFVSGHVDGPGTVLAVEERSGEVRMRIGAGPELTALMVPKGSVAVNGVSLTIAGLQDDGFEVSLIPHTMRASTLNALRPGRNVNIECDMIGKWVRKLMDGSLKKPSDGKRDGLTMEKLMQALQ